jgi:hypothetical protein
VSISFSVCLRTRFRFAARRARINICKCRPRARVESQISPQVNNRSGENYMNLFERRIEQKPTFAFLDRTNKSTRSSVACACKVPSSSPTTEAMATAALFVVRIQSSFLSDVYYRLCLTALFFFVWSEQAIPCTENFSTHYS